MKQNEVKTVDIKMISNETAESNKEVLADNPISNKVTPKKNINTNHNTSNHNTFINPNCPFKLNNKNEYNIPLLITRLNEYITQTEYPILEEFAYKSNINKNAVYELVRNHKDFAEIAGLLHTKAEVYLNKNGVLNKLNPYITGLALRQVRFGWTDKQAIEHSNNKTIADLIGEYDKSQAAPVNRIKQFNKSN